MELRDWAVKLIWKSLIQHFARIVNRVFYMPVNI